MFVQVITARAKDPDAVHAAFDRWVRDLGPGAEGWLGSTGGITADGRLALIARFSSVEAAQRNSDRPEQGAWWQELATSLDGVSFDNSIDVDEWMGGGSDDAGFVQFIRGRAEDVARIKQLNREMEEHLSPARKDVLGGIVVWHEDDRFTEIVYFTSEAEAREAEKQGFPPGAEVAWEGWKNTVSELEYIDLPDPFLQSPG